VDKAAKDVGATYISLISPDVVKKEFVLPDGGHVSDKGHAAIAERVIAALR
jgi:lysophospholipase L1-like esterase